MKLGLFILFNIWSILMWNEVGEDFLCLNKELNETLTIKTNELALSSRLDSWIRAEKLSNWQLPTAEQYDND